MYVIGEESIVNYGKLECKLWEKTQGHQKDRASKEQSIGSNWREPDLSSEGMRDNQLVI